MIDIVEAVGTGLVYMASFGMIIMTIILYRKNNRPSVFFFLVGLVIGESGRLLRVFGPETILETAEGWVKAPEGASLIIYLGQVLIMPIGLIIAAIGFAFFVFRFQR